MAESGQYLVFPSWCASQRPSPGVANELVDFHFFLEREAKEFASASRATSLNAKIAHHALAASYKKLVDQSQRAINSFSGRFA